MELQRLTVTVIIILTSANFDDKIKNYQFLKTKLVSF